MILQFLIKPAINLSIILIPVSTFFVSTVVRSSKQRSPVGRRGVFIASVLVDTTRDRAQYNISPWVWLLMI